MSVASLAGLGLAAVLITTILYRKIFMGSSPKLFFKRILVRTFGESERINKLADEGVRKLFHVLGMVVPLAFWSGLRVFTWGADNEPLLGSPRAQILVRAIAVPWVIFDLVRCNLHSDSATNKGFLRAFSPVLRPGESTSVTGASYYAIGMFLSICGFTAPLALAGQLCLVLGDLAASIVGMRIGSRKIYGNKTWEGAIACFLVSFGCCLVVLMFGGASTNVAVIASLSGAFFGTAGELMCVSKTTEGATWRLDDNAVMPPAVCFGIFLAFSLIGGTVDLPCFGLPDCSLNPQEIVF